MLLAATGGLVVGMLAFTVAEAALAARGEQPKEPPNVVVIMTDDQEVDSVRHMSNVKRHLARSGTTFRNSYATLPVCCPSRTTFLTGQYAHNHGIWTSQPPKGGYAAFDDSESLPVAMRRGGYRTGYVGRYLNGYDELRVPPGWTEWHVPLGLGAFSMYAYSLNENGRIRSYGRAPRDYQTDVFADKAARFIRSSSRGDKPFFLTLAPLAPHEERRQREPNPRPAPRHRNAFEHLPLPRPPSFNERDVSDKPASVRNRPRLTRDQRHALERHHRARVASLLAVDDAVERVVGELREGGELDNTLIAYTSDNGYLLGQHRLVAKKRLYEGSAGVPLIIRGPGVPLGAIRDQIVGNIDLAPTILAAAGIEPLRPVDGRSLIPLARGPQRAANRDLLLENTRETALRTPTYMYAEHATGERELYDMIDDPFQLESRHDDPALADLQARLAERLDQLRDCAGPGCR